MKKKFICMLLVAMMVFSLAACGGSDDKKGSEPKQEAKTAEKSADVKTLESLKGKPLTDAINKINEMGYTATYLADGVDFTEFIDSVKDDYTTGEMKINEKEKTVEVTLELTSNIEADESANALEEKLHKSAAWIAAEDYGKMQYGKGFDLNYFMGKLNESLEDENTWFLKAECEVDGVGMTCEAKVTGTTDAPEVIEFTVY